jgi:hemoglobin
MRFLPVGTLFDRNPETSIAKQWVPSGSHISRPIGCRSPVNPPASVSCTGTKGLSSWHMQTVFEAAGGNEGLRRLAYAWHNRVMADDIVAHAFSHGFHPQHVERLAAYWAEALGGPTTYSDSYGDETTVVKMHSGNGEHDEMNRRAIACFDQALADVGLEVENPVSVPREAWEVGPAICLRR